MFDLTRQERLVLIFLVLICLFGISFRLALKVNPQLNRMVNVLEDDKLYRPIDINRASLEDLIRVPGIGPAIAERIVTYRQDHGSFKDLEELKTIRGVNASNVKMISKYLKIDSR
ncbi:MAG: helix-hairpin-helix domain-containing protein [Candidatus Omnitrophota bacterium]